MRKEKDRIVDLRGIYRELDEAGKEQMVSVVEQYLTVKNSKVKNYPLNNGELKGQRVLPRGG